MRWSGRGGFWQNSIRCLCPFLAPEHLPLILREAKPGGFQTRVFPIFSGKVQIVSRTLSGLFLVGALKRPRKRKRTNRENPRTIPEQIGKIPEKSGKSKKDKKGQKRKDKSRSRNPPLLKPPRLAALDNQERLVLCTILLRQIHLEFRKTNNFCAS